MISDLDGKIAIVTGAAGHLGRALTGRLRDVGATVVGLDAQPPQAAGANGGAVVDLCDTDAVSGLINDVLGRYQRIDCLLNVTGGFSMAPATDLGLWDTLWRKNLLTTLNVTRAMLPSMLARNVGAIVNVAARVEPARAQMAAYAASKSAVICLTESLAAEVRASGVRVNCVMPSILDTPPNRQAMPDAETHQWVSPEALADVMLFLCSDAARAIHGAAIPVFGLS